MYNIILLGNSNTPSIHHTLSQSFFLIYLKITNTYKNGVD